MVHRRKNLLDAFRASAPAAPPNAGAPSAPHARPAPPTPAAAAPRASTNPAPVSSATPSPTQPPARPAPVASNERAARAPFGRERTLFQSLVAVALVALAAYWVGRSRASVADAAGDSSATLGASASAPGASATPAAPPPSAQKPPAGATDQDRAFYDRANKFTVRLAQYDNDSNGVDFARDAYKYLQVEGVLVVQPIVSGDGRHIFVCADAKPTKDELLVMCDFVKRLRGPNPKSKKLPFDGAYIDNIDHVVKRL